MGAISPPGPCARSRGLLGSGSDGRGIERMERSTQSLMLRLVGWGLDWYPCTPINEQPVGSHTHNHAYLIVCLAFASSLEAGCHTRPVFRLVRAE